MLLLVPDKEHKTVFTNVSVAGFHNDKNLKGYLVRAACGKKTCLGPISIKTTSTFMTKVCGEAFKIQSCRLSCNLKKVL